MTSGAAILLAGEAWVTVSRHIKGFDEFSTCSYSEGHHWLSRALTRAGFEVEHLPSHRVPVEFPSTLEELKKYRAVILSDIGASSIYLHPDTFDRSKIMPNRLELVRTYVEGGGGLVMIGGYMSFQGVEGKARYHGTPIEEALPVHILPTDDRVEMPQGIAPQLCRPEHPIVKGLPDKWPAFLGYNRLAAKPGSVVVASVGNDPFLVVAEYGQGRSLAFASDCAPHWAPPGFLEWTYHDVFWARALGWVSKLPESDWLGCAR